MAPIRAGSEADLISDDEFEALLDQLHGDGVPTSVVAPPVAEPAVPPPVAAAPALAVTPEEGCHTMRLLECAVQSAAQQRTLPFAQN